MTNPWDVTFPHLDGMFRIGQSFGGIVQTILSIRSFQFVFLYRVYSVFMKKWTRKRDSLPRTHVSYNRKNSFCSLYSLSLLRFSFSCLSNSSDIHFCFRLCFFTSENEWLLCSESDSEFLNSSSFYLRWNPIRFEPCCVRNPVFGRIFGSVGGIRSNRRTWICSRCLLDGSGGLNIRRDRK